MKLLEFLNDKGVQFEITEHNPTFSAQRMAAQEHEHGRFVAKPVIVGIDGQMVMCVLDANHKIDLKALKEKLGAKKVDLASEDEIGGIFTDCELGAEPPFGNLYDIETIMDKSLESDDHIVFQAGAHNKAVKMTMADYRKLVQPKIMAISY
jgi:Ala-tRNA(Pro) deacylase